VAVGAQRTARRTGSRAAHSPLQVLFKSAIHFGSIKRAKVTLLAEWLLLAHFANLPVILISSANRTNLTLLSYKKLLFVRPRFAADAKASRVFVRPVVTPLRATRATAAVAAVDTVAKVAAGEFDAV